MSQNDLRLHFGLAGAKVADMVEVRWPTTGEVEQFKAVPVNQILTIKEGSGIIPRARPSQQSAAENVRHQTPAVQAR